MVEETGDSGKLNKHIKESLPEKIIQIQADKIGRLEKWIDDLQSDMFINCVYCGHQYGPNDEVGPSMRDALKAHVEQCRSHPMYELKNRIEVLELDLLEYNKMECHCCGKKAGHFDYVIFHKKCYESYGRPYS